MTLLTGAAAERAREAVADIATALRDDSVYAADPDLRSSSVGRGTAGPAVFFAEYAAATGDEKDAETALSFLDVALDLAAEETPTALLYAGTVGVGWTLAYLSGRLLDDDDDSGAPNDVDDLVERALADGVKWPSTDLIRGVTGTGIYLLERLPHPHVRPLLDRVVARLTDMSEQQPQGTTWFVPPEGLLPDRREAYPNGYYDTGMAHGQAGVIALLAVLLANGVTSAKPLLESTTVWLLAQRLDDAHGPGRYPLIIDKRAVEPQGGRIAWCYGDAGVAVALLAAGRALHDEAVLSEAHAVAVESIGRTDAVVDAPLCHGSAGLMHLYHRLGTAFGDERLLAAARAWSDIALGEHRRSDTPVAGYGSVRVTEDPPYQPLGGFLEGAAGVGLALLAATTDAEYGWDSLLMSKPVPA